MRRNRIRTVSDATLNKLCRQLVVVLRDRDTCQRCGQTYRDVQIQWAHVYNRSAKSIQWQPWASVALCANCHRWADSNRESAFDVGNVREVQGLPPSWWRAKYPDRALKLDAWRTMPQYKRLKIDRSLIRLDLLDQIERMGG